ncbi:MAG: putative iron-sulfur-binding oxidoreductase FadF [Myxococcota bacterium]|nr:putative iron-sulfur-binding oxidoreductase FadF [Myxococcota bacterium]
MSAGFSAQDVKALGKCTFCPKMCRFSCPVSHATASESLTPWGKMLSANSIREGKLPLDEANAAVMWGCSGCFACQPQCKHGNDVPSALTAARALAAEKGLTHPAAGLKAGAQRSTGHPGGLNCAEIAREALPQVTDRPKAPVLLWPGESGWLNQAQEARLAAGVLIRLETEPFHIPRAAPWTTGKTLYDAGFWDDFRAHAPAVAAAIRPYRKIVCLDPADAWMLSVIYPRFRVRVKPAVLTFAAWVNSLSPHGAAGAAPEVLYHDNCLLGRGLNQHDLPRGLLRGLDGESPREFHLKRERSLCCGAGSLLPSTMPETAAAMAREITRVLRESPAAALVNASPACVAHLRASDPAAATRIMSLVEYLHLRLLGG